MKFPAPPRPDLVYGPHGEGEVEVGEDGDTGAAAGAYWLGSLAGDMEEE